MISFGILISIDAIFYFLFFGGVFEVKEIKIVSLLGQDLSAEESVQLRTAAENWINEDFLFFKKSSNPILLSKSSLSSALLDQFKDLESLNVKRASIHVLEIEVGQRRSAGIWCLARNKSFGSTQDKCFYFDKNGIAYREAARSQGFIIVNVIDQRDRNLEIGSKVDSENWYKNILLTTDLLLKEGIDVLEMDIKPDSFEEFGAKTRDGWVIMFSLSTDIQKQISAMNLFFKQKMTPDKIKALNYIDLRIQDRIYYK